MQAGAGIVCAYSAFAWYFLMRFTFTPACFHKIAFSFP